MLLLCWQRGSLCRLSYLFLVPVQKHRTQQMWLIHCVPVTSEPRPIIVVSGRRGILQQACAQCGRQRAIRIPQRVLHRAVRPVHVREKAR